MKRPTVKHEYECNCEECHKIHVEDMEVWENARMIEFRCCRDQADEWTAEGELK